METFDAALRPIPSRRPLDPLVRPRTHGDGVPSGVAPFLVAVRLAGATGVLATPFRVPLVGAQGAVVDTHAMAVPETGAATTGTLGPVGVGLWPPAMAVDAP